MTMTTPGELLYNAGVKMVEYEQEISELKVLLELQAAQLKRLRAQLPEGMKDCTILYFQCEKGHGRLTAANWVESGCDVCAMQALELEVEALGESPVSDPAWTGTLDLPVVGGSIEDRLPQGDGTVFGKPIVGRSSLDNPELMADVVKENAKDARKQADRDAEEHPTGEPVK